MYIKIPGTKEGLPAIEEAIFAGIPINVTLLFDDKQYLAAADAYMKGIERRIEAGLSADIASVASIFMSRWDVAVSEEVPDELHNRLALAIGFQAYRAYRELLDSPRVQRLMNEGARPQRLLWASTGTKDPNASDTLYIEGFASPFTVNTMPEPTLHAFADHGEVGELIPADGVDCDQVLTKFKDAEFFGDQLPKYVADRGFIAVEFKMNFIAHFPRVFDKGRLQKFFEKLRILVFVTLKQTNDHRAARRAFL